MPEFVSPHCEPRCRHRCVLRVHDLSHSKRQILAGVVDVQDFHLLRQMLSIAITDPVRPVTQRRNRGSGYHPRRRTLASSLQDRLSISQPSQILLVQCVAGFRGPACLLDS